MGLIHDQMQSDTDNVTRVVPSPQIISLVPAIQRGESPTWSGGLTLSTTVPRSPRYLLRKSPIVGMDNRGAT